MPKMRQTTKQERFEEFRYDLPLICNCGYPMKCITKPSVVIDDNIITTEYLELADTELVGVSLPIEPILYECTSCLKRIKVGSYE